MADAMQPLPLSALAGSITPGRKGRRSGGPGVLVEEVRPSGIATIIARQGQTEALAAKVRLNLGCDLPLKPRRVDSAGVALIWAGPGRWLALAAADHVNAPFAADLETRLSGLASVMDQGHARWPST